ncbi:hypothetical protein ACFSC6_06010 [Rufibacter sediminis]|uniref:Uncharacterized protein n=1 Tax=Rufibacter sediminis TaxID=2762756 RepID=A0ABR6VYZ5_9BACT|nr:hypothetical protein [Rufibacter sediminis]MBC3542440.1 hypothetical protein [Rufibacter sediminis]
MKKNLLLCAALPLFFLASCNSATKPTEGDVEPTATEDRDPSVRAQDFETGAADNRADTIAPAVDSSGTTNE